MAQARKAQPAAERHPILARGVREAALLVVLVCAAYVLLALLTYHPQDPAWSHAGGAHTRVQNAGGWIGAWVADVSLYVFGLFAFLFPLLIGLAGWRWLRPASSRGAPAHGPGLLAIRIGALAATIIAGSALARLLLGDAGMAAGLPATAGGVLGDLVANALGAQAGAVGTKILLLALFVVGIVLFTGWSWLGFIDAVGRATLDMLAAIRSGWTRLRESSRARASAAERERTVKATSKKIEKREPVRIEPVVRTVEPSPRVERERQKPLFKATPGPAGALLPALDLLDAPPPQKGGYSAETLQAMSRQLELKLADFGVEAEVVAATPGPVITRFELQPAPGIKASRIVGLAKDLARALSTVSVRVVEIIPGKSVIGIEIPNEQRELIALSEILHSRDYDRSASPLTLVLGKDISGQPIVADLQRMPHLLVAGTTGSGKSVALNAMILSLLYKSTPDQVRLIFIDPKMLELSVYEGIPHLLAPVVTDMADASSALRWCVAEMERRYRLMAAFGVRNMTGFNRKLDDAAKRGEPLRDPFFVAPPPFTADGEPAVVEPAPLLEKMPFIVVVVDELADMMMIVGKKVEELIARLAQKARAAGIHLILATQRPSVDVITGLIKANIPTRVAFQVSAKVDSRTILDQMGAETLLGQGDMLYLPPGTGLPVRVHGAFVGDNEVHKVVEFLRSTGEPNYVAGVTDDTADLPLLPGEVRDGDSARSNGGESDPLYDQAVRIVTETRRASISGVQRRLQIGYNRAARMIEEMEAAGIVSAPMHNGMREVIAPPPPED
ncbi:MAG: DNA translocase FtsK 4TM domain-containing protein [Chromatiales bacterium]|nr:DNA translocase FtsK 4TM domain-containing protein [Chromatiales bacterium]